MPTMYLSRSSSYFALQVSLEFFKGLIIVIDADCIGTKGLPVSMILGYLILKKRYSIAQLVSIILTRSYRVLIVSNSFLSQSLLLGSFW